MEIALQRGIWPSRQPVAERGGDMAANPRSRRGLPAIDVAAIVGLLHSTKLSRTEGAVGNPHLTRFDSLVTPPRSSAFQVNHTQTPLVATVA